MLSSGHHAARKLTHARILLLSDSGPEGPGMADSAISQTLGVDVTTIERIRQRFVEEGFEAALVRKPSRRHYPRILDGDAEAKLTLLACSTPPEGCQAWTAQLLADQMVVLGHVDAVSRSTVQRALKKTTSNRG
jgi:transposase